MMPTVVKEQAPVPPPFYQRAQAKLGPAFHLDALTLVTMLHLLTLCRLAVGLAHRRCPPPLPADLGGAPRTYSEERGHPRLRMRHVRFRIGPAQREAWLTHMRQEKRRLSNQGCVG